MAPKNGSASQPAPSAQTATSIVAKKSCKLEKLPPPPKKKNKIVQMGRRQTDRISHAAIYHS